MSIAAKGKPTWVSYLRDLPDGIVFLLYREVLSDPEWAFFHRRFRKGAGCGGLRWLYLCEQIGAGDWAHHHSTWVIPLTEEETGGTFDEWLNGFKDRRIEAWLLNQPTYKAWLKNKNASVGAREK